MPPTLFAITLVAALLAACESKPDTSRLPAAGHVVLAAGDIAGCGTAGDEETAALLERLPGTVLTLGDNVYSYGTPVEFARCYAPSWGRLLSRTHPTPGNHEYRTPGASGYFGYFGAAAGDAGAGWYSFDVGAWHVVALNSEVNHAAGSPQEQWLREDLAGHHAACTLAFMHRPRFSSGQHGSDPRMQPLWQALYDAGADVVLAGHDHNYERFEPLRPDGSPDAQRGIREFVVGTGGKSLRQPRATAPGSELKLASSYGVLRLALDDEGYAWDFVAANGRILDSGKGRCH